MANQALFRPHPAGPQPVAGSHPEMRTSPLLNSSDGVFADRAFGWVILGCALVVLLILALIVWQLVSRSELSWHAFGWKFFWGQDWDPVNDIWRPAICLRDNRFFIAVALVIAIPLAVGCRSIHHRNVPEVAARSALFTTELLAAIPSVIYGLGRSSCWFRFCGTTWNRSSRKRWDGLGCLRAPLTESECWLPGSSWPS